MPSLHLVPVPRNYHVTAPTAQSAVSGEIVDVTRVRVPHTVLHRDLPRLGERGRGSTRFVSHLPIGMERAEVHRDIAAQILHHPQSHLLEFPL